MTTDESISRLIGSADICGRVYSSSRIGSDQTRSGYIDIKACIHAHEDDISLHIRREAETQLQADEFERLMHHLCVRACVLV